MQTNDIKRPSHRCEHRCPLFRRIIGRTEGSVLRVAAERAGRHLLRRRQPLISSRPLESRATAPTAWLGSISGVGSGWANTGAENALSTSTNPRPQDMDGITLEIHFRALNFIVSPPGGISVRLQNLGPIRRFMSCEYSLSNPRAPSNPPPASISAYSGPRSQRDAKIARLVSRLGMPVPMSELRLMASFRMQPPSPGLSRIQQPRVVGCDCPWRRGSGPSGPDYHR